MEKISKYEPVAYCSVQYAPALCIWREIGDIDAIQNNCVRVGYMDDAGQPVGRLRWQVIKYAGYGQAYDGRAYVRYRNRRYYLDDFMSL